MKKIIIITLAALLFTSCSVFRKTNRTKIDTTSNIEIQTQIEEITTVINDTAFMTEPETVYYIGDYHLSLDTIFKIEGKKVEAEAVIKDGIIKLTATAKPQEIKINQVIQTITKTNIKEKSKINEAVKEKVKEVEKKTIPGWIFITIGIIIALFLIYYFVIRKI